MKTFPRFALALFVTFSLVACNDESLNPLDLGEEVVQTYTGSLSATGAIQFDNATGQAVTPAVGAATLEFVVLRKGSKVSEPRLVLKTTDGASFEFDLPESVSTLATQTTSISASSLGEDFGLTIHTQDTVVGQPTQHDDVLECKTWCIGGGLYDSDTGTTPPENPSDVAPTEYNDQYACMGTQKATRTDAQIERQVTITWGGIAEFSGNGQVTESTWTVNGACIAD